MSPEVVGLGLSMVVFGVAGVRWAVRQESRLDSHDILFVEREKLGAAREAKANERHTETLDRLDRLEHHLLDLKRRQKP